MKFWRLAKTKKSRKKAPKVRPYWILNLLESLLSPLDWMLVYLKLPPAFWYYQVTLLFPALSGENYCSLLPVCTSTVLILFSFSSSTTNFQCVLSFLQLFYVYFQKLESKHPITLCVPTDTLTHLHCWTLRYNNSITSSFTPTFSIKVSAALATSTWNSCAVFDGSCVRSCTNNNRQDTKRQRNYEE